MKLFVDTNVFLRFLTEDNPTQSEQARGFLDQAVDDTNTTLITSDPVIMELVYTLRSFYNMSAEQTETQVATILGFCRVVGTKDRFDWHRVFSIEQEHNVDFIDAVNYLIMRENKLDTIVSFDTDFDAFDDITREEP